MKYDFDSNPKFDLQYFIKVILVFFLCIKQLIRLNAEGQLGVGERCIDADGQGIKLIFCHLGTVNGPWEYDEVSFLLFLIAYLEMDCLEISF